ncbi:hypothetical protein BJX76DRAFT_128186 [Aspergillus varians]
MPPVLSKKRRRLSSPGTSKLASATPYRSSQAQDTADTSALSLSPAYPDTVATPDRRSISALALRYKEWRQHGSVHDKHCAVCLRKGRLEPCHTCSLSFHVSCFPRGWIRDSMKRWFCPSCVKNEWHISPPSLTPPASPKLLPSALDDRESGFLQGVASAYSSESRSNPPTDAAGLSKDAPRERNSQTHSYNLHTDLSSPRLDETTNCQRQPIDSHELATLSNPPTEQYHLPPIHTLQQEPNPGDIGKDLPPSTHRHRRSRYSTLPGDVDASLSVLYRELESASTLRSKVEELRNENAKFHQMIQLRDLEVAALRREMDSQHLSLQNLETLRTSAAELEQAKLEIEDLRAKNAALQSDLDASREQAATATELVNDWKGKLANLLGN